VGAAFELGHPRKQEMILESVKTKITGYDRSKLIVRNLTHRREFLKGILEENYAARRALEYYGSKVFSARQEKVEGVAS
jgi:hypothetical protein